MSLDWRGRLSFYIDPKLRSLDKELFRAVIQTLEDSGSTWSEREEEMERDPVLPATYFLSADSSFSPTLRPGDKVLLVGAENMSIFGKREFNGQELRIRSAKDWKRFYKGLEKTYSAAFEAAEKDLIRLGQDEFKRLLKKAASFSFEKSSAMQELEEDLLGELTFEDVRARLPKATEEILGASYFALSAPQAWGSELSLLPFTAKRTDSFFLAWEGEPKAQECLWIYSLLEDIAAREFGPSLQDGKWEDVQTVISDLPLPLALFNKRDELVLHNALFIKLNLSAKSCLALEDEAQFNHEKELYRTKRQKLEAGDYELFTFFPVGEFLGAKASSSSEELGIISSSVAHELNNPLGGVSGALDVILLDPHPPEREQSLRDMKAGVLRCKKLVETFLGFSKLEAQKTGQAQERDVESCLSSAMDLIRFRLIENNISMETKFSRVAEFKPAYNPHVLAMTLYLALSELLTEFGHQKLVSGDRSAHFQTRFKEESFSLSLSWEDEARLGEAFLKSKLFKHLLEIQGLSAQSRNGGLALVTLRRR